MAPAKSSKKSSTRSFVVMKSSKVNTKKPMSKQGKTIKSKGTSTQVASKFAMAALKKGVRVSKLVLFRKDKLMEFKVSFKKSAGKVKVCSKRVRVTNLAGKAGKSKVVKSCRTSAKKRSSAKKSSTKKRKTSTKSRKPKRKSSTKKRRRSSTKTPLVV